MAQIFISYSSKSRDLVSVLAQDFETAGHNVWFDKELTGGQSWWDQILTNIRACDILAFAMTPEAIDSKACEREYTYAHALGKPILPVLMKDGVSPNTLPAILTTIQFIDYRKQDKAAAFALIRALGTVPPTPPLPNPLPEPPTVPLSYLSGLREQIESAQPLTFQEQSALVLRLKQGLQEGDNIDDIRSLLLKLKKRDDTLVRVGDEINGLLISSGGLPDVTPVPTRRDSVFPQEPSPSTPSSYTPPSQSSMNVNVGYGAGQGGGSSSGYSASASSTSRPSTPPSSPPPTPPSSSSYRPPSQPYQGSGGSVGQPLTSNAWSNNTLAAIYIGAIFTLGIVGIIAGIIGLQSDGKKGQAKTLLLLSIGYLILGLISAASSMSSYSYY